MICINHKECNSTECRHRVSHSKDDFCFDGKCKWAENTVCVPEAKREQLAALMMTDEWGHMTDARAIDAIMEIFGEEKEGEA